MRACKIKAEVYISTIIRRDSRYNRVRYRLPRMYLYSHATIFSSKFYLENIHINAKLQNWMFV